MFSCSALPDAGTDAALMVDAGIGMIGLPLLGLFLFVGLLFGIWRIIF